MKKFGFAETYSELFDLPKDVEIAVRCKGNRMYFFLLNYSSSSVAVNVKQKMCDLLTGNELQGNSDMAGYGVMVLEYNK